MSDNSLQPWVPTETMHLEPIAQAPDIVQRAVQLTLRDQHGAGARSIGTTAFTDKPVSM
jgi:hypothetical protein